MLGRGLKLRLGEINLNDVTLIDTIPKSCNIFKMGYIEKEKYLQNKY